MLDSTTHDTHGEVLFPHLGSDTRAWMRRIGVVCDVQHVAKNILNWRAGATKDKSLKGAIAFYHRPFGLPLERWEATFDFIEGFAPDGLETMVNEMSREDREAFLAPCIASAREMEKTYRKRLGGVGQ